MKKLLSIFLSLVLFINYLSAQNQSWCGTTMPESYRLQYIVKDRSDYEHLAASRGGGIQWVPVAYHVITKTDGSEGTRLNYKVVSEVVCEMRACNPIPANWKAEIDEDFERRKK